MNKNYLPGFYRALQKIPVFLLVFLTLVVFKAGEAAAQECRIDNPGWQCCAENDPVYPGCELNRCVDLYDWMGNVIGKMHYTDIVNNDCSGCPTGRCIYADAHHGCDNCEHGGGSDPDPDPIPDPRRVVGRVYDFFYGGPWRMWQRADNSCGGTHQTDPSNTMTVSNSSGAGSDWGCNMDPPEPYYSRVAADSGEGPHVFTLTPPAGMECSSWTIGYDGGYEPPAEAVTSGLGCTASVFLGDGEWTNHIWWRIESPFVAPWWQTLNGNVIAGGQIKSEIPPGCVGTCSPYLIRQSGGNIAGIAAFSGILNLGDGTASVHGRKTNNAFNMGSLLRNYQHFLSKLKSNVPITTIGTSSYNMNQFNSSGTQYGGYYWFRYNGSGTLTLTNDVNLGDRKIVLFVSDATVDIQGKINVNDGRGFFLLIAGRDIRVASSVGGANDGIPELEGVYITDGQFMTGTNGIGLDQHLHIRGSVAGLGYSGGVPGVYNGVVFERSLADNSQTPAELFEYAPDQNMLFPMILGDTKIKWTEVAP
jgi:hypothetical protein